MLIQIAEVFTPEEAAEIRRRLDAADWVDGKVTAGYQSAEVKRNRQLPEQHPLAQELGNLILQRLAANNLFMSAALPRKIFPPLFNRYEGGEAFGYHVDNAVRGIAGTAERVRTDLSATLFQAEHHRLQWYQAAQGVGQAFDEDDLADTGHDARQPRMPGMQGQCIGRFAQCLRFAHARQHKGLPGCRQNPRIDHQCPA